MRSAFARTLCEMAAADPRIWLVTGDLGYSVLEPFAERYPSRFVNAGVAEQNMLGLAAGLALAGSIPFVYSIVNFPIMRGLEQLRNDIAYHNLPVKIVTVGGGLVYGAHGYSHHGAEDIGVVRLLPNFSIVVPADPIEAVWATQQTAALPGPCYLRMARGGEPNIHKDLPETSSPFAPKVVRHGIHLTMACCGPILALGLKLAESLERDGITADIFSVPWIAPLNAGLLIASARKTGRLIVLEDHGRGGLGTALAELIAERGERFRFRSMHYRRDPITNAGSLDYLRGMHGLDAEGILLAAREMIAD